MVALAAAGLIGLNERPALGACHAFTVSVDPSTVEEGAVVQVTVSRDAAVGPSQIDVETVDGSARGGADYEAVPRRTISFTNETSQRFPVQTHDDQAAEGPETFRLHLSNPGGCTVNPNFSVGPDATVTIAANDGSGAPRTTAAPTTSTTAVRPGTTGSTEPPEAQPDDDPGAMSPPPSEPPPDEEATDTSGPVTTTGMRDDQIALAGDEDDGGSALGVILAAAALAAAVGGAGWWTWRRQLQPTE